MWYKATITAVLLICVLTISQCCKFFTKRDKDTRFKRNFLRGRWKKAKDNRLRWKNEHPWASFDDPEYQELWEIEIGAEDLYLLSIKIRGYHISWSDWCFARKKAQQEMDDD